MERNQKKAQSILRQLERLANGRANDAVKLLYLDEADRDEIDRLDLTALTEFKRSANGAVELKFSDRAALLERIYYLLQDGTDDFFRTLDGENGAQKS